MKKTIIALLALGGVAAAADVTIGSYVTKDSVNYDIVDSFAGETYDDVDSTYGVHLDKLHFKSLTFVLNTGDMLVSDSGLKTGDALTLKSLTILGRYDTNDYRATDSTMTVTLEDASSYTSSVAVHVRGNSGCATITYDFTDAITFSLGDDLTFTFNRGSAEGDDPTYNLGIAPMQGVSGAPIVYNNVWQMGTQLSVASAAASVPEPTTATLSLLALAGLAARRRRK